MCLPEVGFTIPDSVLAFLPHLLLGLCMHAIFALFGVLLLSVLFHDPSSNPPMLPSTNLMDSESFVLWESP